MSWYPPPLGLKQLATTTLWWTYGPEGSRWGVALDPIQDSPQHKFVLNLVSDCCSGELRFSNGVRCSVCKRHFTTQKRWQYLGEMYLNTRSKRERDFFSWYEQEFMDWLGGDLNPYERLLYRNELESSFQKLETDLREFGRPEGPRPQWQSKISSLPYAANWVERFREGKQ